MTFGVFVKIDRTSAPWVAPMGHFFGVDLCGENTFRESG